MQGTGTTELPPTLSVERAGRLLGLSRTSAYRAVERGELPTIRLAGRMHVPTARLFELLGYPVGEPTFEEASTS